MGYSKIVSVEVQNFMVYKHAKIMFDDQNIINIKGYNSAGKSTMLKAIAVCLMDMFGNKQSKLIRHGERFFRIIISFDDGISILRDKYDTGQSLYEMYKDNECIFTTKQGNKLTRLQGIPEPIQKYLGLCFMEKGCLNYQSREDPLWLVETTGSQNYNSLNEILKTAEIARANALLNSDKNKLGGEISSIEAELQAAEIGLSQCSEITEETIIALSEHESKVKELTTRYRKISKLQSLVSELGSLKKLPVVTVIPTKKAEMIEAIASTYSELSSIKKPPVVEQIPVNRYEKLVEISKISSDLVGIKHIPKVDSVNLEKSTSINSLLKTIKDLNDVTKNTVGCQISTVEVKPKNDLVNIVSTLQELIKVKKLMKSTNETFIKTSKELVEIVDDAKARGYRFIKCDNCGSYMEVSNS